MINCLRAEWKKMRFSHAALCLGCALALIALAYLGLRGQTWASFGVQNGVQPGFFTLEPRSAPDVPAEELAGAASCAHTLIFWIFAVFWLDRTVAREVREHTCLPTIAKGVSRGIYLGCKLLSASVFVLFAYALTCLLACLVHQRLYAAGPGVWADALPRLGMNAAVLEGFLLLGAAVFTVIRSRPLACTLLFVYLFAGLVALMAVPAPQGLLAALLHSHPMYFWLRQCGLGGPSWSWTPFAYALACGGVSLTVSFAVFQRRDLSVG